MPEHSTLFPALFCTTVRLLGCNIPHVVPGSCTFQHDSKQAAYCVKAEQNKPTETLMAEFGMHGPCWLVLHVVEHSTWPVPSTAV